MRRRLAAGLMVIALSPSLAWGADGQPERVVTVYDRDGQPRGVVTGMEIAREGEFSVVQLPDGATLQPLPEAPHPVAGAATPKQTTDALVKLEQKIAELERLRAEVDELRMAAGAPQQFVVHIELLEVNHTKLREFGTDFARFAPGSVVTASFENAFQGGFNIVGPSAGAPEFFAMLKQNNLAKPLSDPTLVVTSGKPASFLVGGQLPIPAAPGSDSAVTYKDFGTSVEVRADALGGNRVRLDLTPRFSEIDESHGIVIDGQRVPSLRVKQFSTGCEMTVGETVAFGGLTENRIESRRLDGGRVEEVAYEIGLWLVVRAEAAQPMDPEGR